MSASFYLYDSSGGLMMSATRVEGGLLIAGHARLVGHDLDRFVKWIAPDVAWIAPTTPPSQ